MKIAAIIMTAILAIITVVIVILARYGLFAAPVISEKNAGPYLLVYAKHAGDYKNVGPVMDELYNDLKNNFSIGTTKGFGLYFDNPQEVDKNTLRSIVGCIVEGKTMEELKAVSGKYGVKEYPASQSVVAEFPYRGSLSIIIGVFKVYPKLSAYIKEKNYPSTPIMELYDLPNGRTEYIASVKLSPGVFEEFL